MNRLMMNFVSTFLIIISTGSATFSSNPQDGKRDRDTQEEPIALKKKSKRAAAKLKLSVQKNRFKEVKNAQELVAGNLGLNQDEDDFDAALVAFDIDTLIKNRSQNAPEESEFSAQDFEGIDSAISQYTAQKQLSIEKDEDFLAAAEKAEADYNQQKNSSSTQSTPVKPFQGVGIPDDEDSYLEAMDLSDDLPVNTYGFPGFHLSTPEDHYSYALGAIASAQKSILITSFNFSAQIKDESGLCKALREASYRGVKVYIYYDHESIGQAGWDFFEKSKNQIQLTQVNIHSKMLVVDQNICVRGSHNWLEKDDYSKTGINDTIAFEGNIYKPFIEHIWSTIRSYRALSYNNRAARKFDQKFERANIQTMDFGQGNEVELITTPQRHRDIFFQALLDANYRVSVCAFSVTAYPQLLEHFFPIQLVEDFLNAGKKLEVFYNPEMGTIGRLKDHLADFLHNQDLTLVPVQHLHQKTLIMDDSLYVCGSYNWLSSAETVLDNKNYMETSVVVSGIPAQLLIEEFDEKFSGFRPQ